MKNCASRCLCIVACTIGWVSLAAADDWRVLSKLDLPAELLGVNWRQITLNQSQAATFGRTTIRMHSNRVYQLIAFASDEDWLRVENLQCYNAATGDFSCWLILRKRNS